MSKIITGEEKLQINFDEVPELIHAHVEVSELEQSWMLDLGNTIEIDVT